MNITQLEQELLGMTTWYGLIDDNLDNLHDLSSDDIGTLTTLAEDINDYRASGLARALLELNNAPVDYTEPVYFPGQTAYKSAPQALQRPANLQKQFSLSPNPTTEYIILTWAAEELYPVGEFTIAIYDLQGKVLIRKNVDDVSLERQLLNVSSLSAGTYLLEVNSGEKGLYDEKFVVAE